MCASATVTMPPGRPFIPMGRGMLGLNLKYPRRPLHPDRERYFIATTRCWGGDGSIHLWKRHETTPLKIICHHLNLVPDFSHRPFQSFKQIVKFRNLMAHATSEKISDKGIQFVRDGERVKYPETWWVKHSTLEIAKRWLADTESIISTITTATGRDDIPPLGMLSMGTHISKIM